MARVKKAFFCNNCGQESPKWMGKCPSCGEWNTFQEEIVQKTVERHQSELLAEDKERKKPTPIQEVNAEKLPRISVTDLELSRVLGGGIVPGSLILFGGEPGIGKSTLLLQTALGNPNLKVLYISGEESAQQIKMRADRIGIENPQCLLSGATSTTEIIQQAREYQPDLLIIDSVQTVFNPILDSHPGSISQLRECTGEFMRLAKTTGIPIFLIGHITKDGSLAGPKVLEHMVDAVLQFEGDRNHLYRLLRSLKNRFGSTNELGIYEMEGAGLRQIHNPSEILLSNHAATLSGTSVAASLEGIRPLLIEVQALVSTAAYGTPQRSATGFDTRRLNMLLAVLEKRCGFRLGQKDVFVNLAGGIRMDDPALDLAMVCSVLSSGADVPLPPKTCFAGEVGLSGEIRPVMRIEQRISEAEKLGFETFFLSSYSKLPEKQSFNINIRKASKVEEVFRMLFKGE